MLFAVDNFKHESTTAYLLQEEECDEKVFHVHIADAFDPDLPAKLAPGICFDFIWIDLSAAHLIDAFLKDGWWNRIRPGGFCAVHSTLTNELSRTWFEKMRRLARNGGRCDDGKMGEYGLFDQISILEPHKNFQCSLSLFQRRDAFPLDDSEFQEKILMKYP